MNAPAWVKDAIFYQIFPDRFCRSPKYSAVGKFVQWDSKPTRTNMFGGNLAGITDKLKYIADLGATAIYLCPIFKSNSNHRYHTVDYFEIDPVLGTLKDFDNLVKKAHALGLRIILDGVFNHCSRGFFQFNSLMELGEDSPYVDWFLAYTRLLGQAELRMLVELPRAPEIQYGLRRRARIPVQRRRILGKARHRRLAARRAQRNRRR